MSPAELYELMYASQEAMDRLLQLIITISFAVVVTIFFGASRLNGILVSISGAIYSVIYITLAARMFLAFEKTLEFRNRLIEKGESFAEVAWLPYLASVGGVLVYVGTIGFLYYWYKHEQMNMSHGP